jgi:serine protease Do
VNFGQAQNAQSKLPNAKRKIVGIRILRFSFCILHFFAFALCATAEILPRPADREEVALRAAAEHVSESVVQIRTIGGLDSIGRTLLADGPTTGLVISADGYIVSSAFNFVQQPASILVTFASGKQAPAELLATDHSRMLVLLKANGVADLAVPEIAPTNEIRAGQWAIAVGRTFRPDRTNVSVGIISATERMSGKVIQTDADVSIANYGGPLVDIRGRVLGVIVPMAPQATSEVAGVEWYDSGIGFAAPLAAITERLERMKKGEDQRAGLLGIGLVPKNPHSAPAELAAVRPGSPAGKARLKKGDRIVEIDGRPIRTQTDLRFALGPRYGGDNVKIVVERGEERFNREIELIGELPVFRHAFLGILPQRLAGDAASDGNEESEKKGDHEGPSSNESEKTDDNAEGESRGASGDANREGSDDKEKGVAVRMVYAGSPAEQAGVQIGDRIVRINDADVATIGDALAEINNSAPGSEVELHLIRAGKLLEVNLTASRLPTSVPGELPPAFDDGDMSTGAAPAGAGQPEAQVAKEGETNELKLPEFSQQCKIYLPAKHDQGRALGLMFWLHAPGKTNVDEVIREWQAICDRDGLILVVPTASQADRWDRTELEYLARLLERVLSQHKIDPLRVVVYGEEGGGAMAWLLAVSGRHVIRGVATSAAPLPRQLKVPPNEPTQRLAVVAAVPHASDDALPIVQGLQKFSEAGYPVTTLTDGDASEELSAAEREELARWIDTLDRF